MLRARCSDLPDPNDAIAVASRWCEEELTEEQREFLALQPETLATDYECEAAVTRILAKAGPVADKFAERVLAPPPASTAVERWG